MARDKRKDALKAQKTKSSTTEKVALPNQSFIADPKSIDPALALLFDSSYGPVILPPRSRYEHQFPFHPTPGSPSERHSSSSPKPNREILGTRSDISLSKAQSQMVPPRLDGLTRLKRKRLKDDDQIEDIYMNQLTNEEARDERKHRKTEASQRERTPRVSSGESDHEEELTNAPIHETLAPDPELDKSHRTIFLANVSTTAITSKTAKKTLLDHLSSFLPDLVKSSNGQTCHQVESIRFRSIAFSTASIPKKAAFAKKELMDTTTKSAHAYVVYSSTLAAREAIKRLNGTVVLNRHLRVDSVAHPAITDHRRCVFVGNLGFVDDESSAAPELDADGKEIRKRGKVPSDIEEGLWRQFAKAGLVESVRVVRDPRTRVGKGFAYVQFLDANSVEAALQFNDKRFPPMLPRTLRVIRAKSVQKMPKQGTSRFITKAGAQSQSPVGSKIQPGRAAKLLGRAGAANLVADRSGNKTKVIGRTPEDFVFEGYRASKKEHLPGGKKNAPGHKSSSKRKDRAKSWRAHGGKASKDTSKKS
ncbi:MAG: Nucleolar protein 12 [Trizodia sp. TS-e1964]|nr:MAG: Nucleolar protein 12 [Trizodia sp. TS-e1964]